MINEQIRDMYITKPYNFYAEQMETKNLRALWFRERQYATRRLVEKYFTSGIALDIGCGNCLWNNDGIRTVGIDICEAMLKYNSERLPLFSSLKADAFGELPIKSNSIDLVIITEVLEHSPQYVDLIAEIHRILKKDGVVICSVPYSMFPGLWGFIFPVWCQFKGWRDRDNYYASRCGHMVNFNVKKVREAFNQFSFLESFSIGFLTIFFIAKKK